MDVTTRPNVKIIFGKLITVQAGQGISILWRPKIYCRVCNIIRYIKSRIMRWAGHVARMGEERNVYRVLMGKPEEKRPLGRERRRWDDGIRMDFREIGSGSVDWIHLTQDRGRWPVAGSCEYGDEPSGSDATELVS
jgi:hypothetical protein